VNEDYWGAIERLQREETMITHNVLCANPDCGAFFDVAPIEVWDRGIKSRVLFCQACAVSVANHPGGRYRPIQPEASEDDRDTQA